MLTDQPFTGYRQSNELSSIGTNPLSQNSNNQPKQAQVRAQPKLAQASSPARVAEPKPSFANAKFFSADCNGDIDHPPSDTLCNFPAVQHESKPSSQQPKKKRMPKLKRKSQKVRCSCDADRMSSSNISKVLKFHERSADGALTCDELNGLNGSRDNNEDCTHGSLPIENCLEFNFEMCGQCIDNDDDNNVQFGCNC